MPGSIGQPTQGWFPWQGEFSNTGGVTRANDSGSLGMGYFYGSGASGNQYTWNHYMDAGTWKIAFLFRSDNQSGIADVQIDGVSAGTKDMYTAGVGLNTYHEITGITVATAGVKAIKFVSSTKNASSSAYYMFLHSIALIKTAGAHSTPAGSDTPGYTWMYLPWMGSKANTGWNSRSQNSGYLGGGQLQSSVQNDEVSWDIWLDAGTYKYAQVYIKDSSLGIFHVQLDGVDKGTIDSYAAATAANTYSEITGITVATAGVKTFKLKMATKNASSAGYIGAVQSVAWIRTGA